MSDENCGEGHPQTQSIINQLTETVNRIDGDDIVELAQMHEWCQQLADVCDQGHVTNAEVLTERAKALHQALEALILGDSEDVRQAFEAIQKQVAELTHLVENEIVDTAPESAQDRAVNPEEADDHKDCDDDNNEACNEEIETQLAKVFDDPAPAEDALDADEDATGDEEEAAGTGEELTTATTVPSPVAASNDTADTADSDEPSYQQEPLTLNQDEVDFVKGFVEEASEHIEAIETVVLEVESSPEDAAKINDLFRPFHTIKGMAGFLNLRDIGSLTHEVETLLDQGRKGQRAITPGLIDVIFDVVDVLKVQIASVGEWVADPHEGSVPQPPVSEMIERLRGIVAGRMDPDDREVGPGSGDQKTGENLVQQGVVPQAVVDYAVQRQENDENGKKLGETLVDMKVATPKQVSQAIRPQAQARTKTDGKPADGQKSLGDQSIRIDTAKLDLLVDMVGELVIAQTLVNANPQIANDQNLTKDVSQVSKIVRDVQQVAMAMRMIPIGPTFQKMARLVRDVSRKAGKQVNLTIKGEDTELDKTVIQQIGDPLVHMVRNAIDHGVESPQDRQAAGKPEVGEVYLSAGHQGGNIVIEIQDDGKGLDPQALIHKAIEKGIVQPGEDLTDQQAFHLIFAAGFSTAEKITDISGRGVGMDVVKRNIDQLRGKVEITSEKGHGSTFSIRLPLTLAIIDGMIIRVGGERFILPTIAIEKSLRPLPEQITTVQQKGEVLNVRGQLVPLIQLGEIFGLTDWINPSEAMVIVTHCEGREIGLVVDELIGQQQVVIKTLGERFEQLRGISGAAILGDGRVGLILEMSGLTAVHQSRITTSLRAQRTNPDHQADESVDTCQDGLATPETPIGDASDIPESVEASEV